MNRSLSVISYLVLVACSSPDTSSEEKNHVWHGDVRFNSDQRIQIEAGTAWLYQHAGLESPIIIWDGHPGNIRYGAPLGMMGHCDGLFGNLSLDPEIAGDRLIGLTAHEMAHCRLNFLDRYDSKAGKVSEGIMGRITPMLWTDSEDKQCQETGMCGKSP